MGDAFQDERAKRREERRRRRAEEKQQEEQELAAAKVDVVVLTYNGSDNRNPEIEVKLKKTARLSRTQSEDKQEINEAERKAEEIRLKREREEEERLKEQQEERRNFILDEAKLREMTERKERIRLRQEAEEERLQQEQLERAAKEAEEARKRREDIQKRRLEAEERRRNIENSVAYVKPNFSLSDTIFQVEADKVMTPEEQDDRKQETLERRCPPLRISTSLGVDRLRELILDLQEKLVEVYAAQFDLMKCKKSQDNAIDELTERLANATKVATPKAPIGVTVYSGHVNKIKEKGFFLEEKPVKKLFSPQRTGGIVTNAGVQGRLSMFETKKDKEDDQPDYKKGGKASWKAPQYDKCIVCDKNVYTLERLELDKKLYHKQCFKCEYCKKVTSLTDHAIFEGKVYCKLHQRKMERGVIQQGSTARP